MALPDFFVIGAPKAGDWRADRTGGAFTVRRAAGKPTAPG